MIIAEILIILVLSFILIKSADIVILSLRSISKRTKTGVFALSAIILALGTSLPELFVGVTSALEGAQNLALGVIIGSNIVNINLVAALTALIKGTVKINPSYLKHDVGIALAAGMAPIIFITDKSLSRVDGLILLAIYGIYASSLFKMRFNELAKNIPSENSFYRFFKKVNISGKRSKDFGRLFLALSVMLITADLIVKLSQSIALRANIPMLVIGLLIISVGTSLPELAFSLRSLEKHTPGMFYGNLLGSTITNSTLVLGIVALINPIEIYYLNEYFVAMITFFAVFLLFWLFIKTKHSLERWEAGMLLITYVIFTVLEFM